MRTKTNAARPGTAIGSNPSKESLTQAVREALAENAAELERADSNFEAGFAFRSVAWTFTCAIKGHPDLFGLSAEEAADIIERELHRLHEKGELHFRLSEAGTVWTAALSETNNVGNQQDPLEDFLAIWDRISPRSPLAAAAAAAVEQERDMPDHVFGEEFSHRVRKKFRVFLFLVDELARYAGGDPFPLAVEAVAQELGTDRYTVGRWRRLAIQADILEQVTKEIPHRKAATYRLKSVD